MPSSSISGLLTQKPDRPAPEPGAVRRFSAERREKSKKPGEFYTKIKNEGDGFGQEYKVLKADKTDFVDNHGNVSYSLLIEPLDPTGNPVSGPVSAPNASNGRSADQDRTDQINRSVAFKAAAEIVAARVQNGNLKPEDAAGAIASMTTALLPVVTGEAAPPTPPAESGSPVKTDDDIPF